MSIAIGHTSKLIPGFEHYAPIAKTGNIKDAEKIAAKQQEVAAKFQENAIDSAFLTVGEYILVFPQEYRELIKAVTVPVSGADGWFCWKTDNSCALLDVLGNLGIAVPVIGCNARRAIRQAWFTCRRERQTLPYPSILNGDQVVDAEKLFAFGDTEVFESDPRRYFERLGLVYQSTDQLDLVKLAEAYSG